MVGVGGGRLGGMGTVWQLSDCSRRDATEGGTSSSLQVAFQLVLLWGTFLGIMK